MGNAHPSSASSSANNTLDATLCFCAGDGKQCAYDEETAELLGICLPLVDNDNKTNNEQKRIRRG